MTSAGFILLGLPPRQGGSFFDTDTLRVESSLTDFR